MLKTCPTCGQEREARGFEFHVKNCKSNAKEVTKQQTNTSPEKALHDIFLGMNQSLRKEAENTKKVSMMVDDGTCNCDGYEGKSFTCPVHKAKVECPSCHCIDTATKVSYMDPCDDYRCNMCGLGYQRNLVTGEYLYA